MLSSRDREVLAFIAGRVRATGVSPSYQEMAHALAITSKASISRVMRRLEESGRIRRLHNRARAIEVIPEKPTSRPQVVPLVRYPDAEYFTWDAEAKALKPMETKA